MYNLRENPKETQVRNLAAKVGVVKISPTLTGYMVTPRSYVTYIHEKQAKSRYKPTKKRGYKVTSIALIKFIRKNKLTWMVF